MKTFSRWSWIMAILVLAVNIHAQSNAGIIRGTVKDPSGASSVDRVTVYPGDTPPVPTIVTKRSRASRATSAATASSRPIACVTAKGRLCGAVEGAGAEAARNAASRRTGATKL